MSTIITENEILAPVGGLEQLYAAVRCGADAVYFGTSGFNARRNAQNFSDEEFLSAVKYCHVRGVKAYITLNTLVLDSEMPELISTLRLIAKSGADAVIVQDLAVMAAVKKMCPTLPLHASTQMAVHNVSGAKMLEGAGFSRIVLARELTLDEIRVIAASVKCETEVFVHGAHCMSASGMCYMSSALGARSGNRGLCAQPCRLNFKCRGREYALSLKDMCFLGYLTQLSKAGVCSFKIEGRMKRPEYVAAAVTAAKKALSGENPDLDTLKNVFSRSGFTDGYLMGKRTLKMFGIRTRDDVTGAASVLPGLQALYKDELKRVKLEMKFEAKPECPVSLTLFDGKNSVTVFGATPQKAQHLELDASLCEKSLLKLGGTPYYADSVSCDIALGLMISAACLNALRRDAIEKLDVLRAGTPHKFNEEVPAVIKTTEQKQESKLHLRFEKATQIPSVTECSRIILPLTEILTNDWLYQKYFGAVTPEIPVLLYPANEHRVLDALKKLKAMGSECALCENIGAIYLAKKAGLTPIGGQMLNVINSSAFEEYTALGVKEINLSTEMSFANMYRLNISAPAGMTAYGHMPLMRFRCCPMQGENGCADCTGINKLTDRRGTNFTVMCSQRQYQTLYNTVPLYTGNIKMPVLGFYTLYFSSETKEQCAEVINCFVNRMPVPFGKTAGLYDKELL